MKSVLLSTVVAFAGLAVVADPTVTVGTIRQNWPWDAKVTVDYTLTADEPCDLDYTVSYVADLRPVIETNHLWGVKSGSSHLTWDPVAKGVSGKNVCDFNVTFATPVKVSDRAFLLVKTSDGSISYKSEAEAAALGNFSDVVYRTEYMVFRRVPAGDYTLGLTADELTLLNAGSAKSQCVRRTVTITHDYYLAIHVYTTGQYNYFHGTTSSATSQYKVSYEGMRGTAEEGIMWPNTGHTVSSTSELATLRSKMQLPDGFVLDLATESQWEAGIRGGTTTIMPDYGTAANTKAELLAYLGTIAYTNGGGMVGTKSPTSKGFYDPTGIFWEIVLEMYYTSSGGKANEKFPDFRDWSQTVDPIGKAATYGDTAHLFAMSCNCGYIDKPKDFSLSYTPVNRVSRDRTAATMGVRLCINTQAIK